MTTSLCLHYVKFIVLDTTRPDDNPPTLRIEAVTSYKGVSEINSLSLFTSIPERALIVAAKAFNEAMKIELEAIRAEQIADAAA